MRVDPVAALANDRNPRQVRIGCLAARLRIQGIPTLVIFKDGREVTRMIGVRGQEELQQKLEQVLAAPAV